MSGDHKRSREESTNPEDEVVKRITREVIKSLQQQTNPVNQIETKKQQKSVPPDVLAEKFNEVLKDILRQDGLKLVSDSGAVLEFSGVAPYPFEMNMDLQYELQAAAKRFSGTVWGLYDPCSDGMLIKLCFTQDRGVKVVRSEQDQKEHNERMHKIHSQQTPTTEAGMISHSLVSHVAVDLKNKAVFSQRPVWDDMTVISASVVLADQVGSHQLEKLAVHQQGKMKALTWGKHLTLPKLRLTLDITSASMVDLSGTHESLN